MHRAQCSGDKAVQIGLDMVGKLLFQAGPLGLVQHRVITRMGAGKWADARHAAVPDVLKLGETQADESIPHMDLGQEYKGPDRTYLTTGQSQ